ncbi:MliC family protein [Oceaniglobus ichthyenteri]|uniref:MliC family protein n=1 Tax=Oceaniglobus ichthyenteri TaxID=2136177 RepID=UPI000D3BC1E2|nr:MliC family protein [Oceaniglobus ichthyenteri]
MRTILFTLALCGGATAAAADLSLSLPLGALDSVSGQTYACEGGESFTVQYVNSGANSLAILPIDGETRIFVNVVSGSGARYASGADIWWSKGDTATLENEMTEGSLQNCEAQEAQ